MYRRPLNVIRRAVGDGPTSSWKEPKLNRVNKEQRSPALLRAMQVNGRKYHL
jgi:hypothetical protein